MLFKVITLVSKLGFITDKYWRKTHVKLNPGFFFLAKAAFIHKKAPLTIKLDLNFRTNCYICSTALCGAGTWTLPKGDKEYLESFEMWCWSWMEKIIWTDRARNEEVLHGVKWERNNLHEIYRRRVNPLALELFF